MALMILTVLFSPVIRALPSSTGTGFEHVEAISATENDSVDVSSLPLHLFRSQKPDNNKPLVVIISGDGGWNNFTDGLAKAYVDKGLDVAGIDALRYFWHKSNPKTASGDVSKVIRYFSTKWHKKQVILLGYSFGADVLPFIFNDFENDVKSMIPLLVFMSPSHHASFEFQLTGWLKGDVDSPYLVVPEIKKIRGPVIMIIYGRKESENLTGDFPGGSIHFVPVQGGHHFDDNYTSLIDPVLRQFDSLLR